MKRKIVLVLMFLMLLTGVGIMLYPTVSALLNARSQSQVIVQYQEQAAALSEEEIESYFAAAYAYNERLQSNSVVVGTDPFGDAAQESVSEEYYDLLNVGGDGVMGYINMNISERDISISLPIYHGTSQTVLALGAGHLEGTSLPVGGESTHSVISAHTGLANARMFNDLAKLQEVEEFTDADIFTVTVLGKVLTYQVYSVQVVEPGDISSLSIQEGEDLVTLVTCTPYGVNSHRLLVHGVRTDTTDETAAEPVTVLQIAALSWEYLAAGGAVVLVAIWLLIRRIRRRRKRRRSISELRWKGGE